MAKETILLIEDESDIVEVVRYNLEREGYRVVSASNGEKGLEIAREKQPSAIVLDLMLPGLDGIEVARRLRAHPRTQELALIMLTAKSEESDVILGLGVGADDYVTKPFRVKELVARLQAVLRRGHHVPDGPGGRRIEHSGICIDSSKYQVTYQGDEVPLTLTEFRIVSALAGSPGRVFTRELLLEKIQGEAFIDERNIDVHIRSIRRKLGPGSDLIVTVRGVGYKFKE